MQKNKRKKNKKTPKRPFIEKVLTPPAPPKEEMIVYKYVVPDRIDVLRYGTLRFTQIAALNDPFESTLIPNKLRDSLIEKQKKILASTNTKLSLNDLLDVHYNINKLAYESVDKMINGVLSNKGILSVSLERSQLLMWSHYCDSHRGFIIGFDGLDHFFQKGIQGKRGGLRPIIYSKARPILPTIDDFPKENVAEKLLWYKNPHWVYERELRMLYSLDTADIVPEKLDPNGHKIHLFKFPSHTVREIILGCQMEKTRREEIKALVKEKYHEAKVYQAEMSSTEYDLVFKEVKL